MNNGFDADKNDATSLRKQLTSDTHNGSSQKIVSKSQTNQHVFPKGKLSLWQRFCNLPISNKILTALIASEFLTILGLSISSTMMTAHGLRTQLLEQAKSEVGVAEINYNIKVNQMGFGFRGQSDNTAIIKAAELNASGNSISPELEAEIKRILQNEIQARKIEYATLVGTNSQIIVNANNNRKGEVFNPNNLVSEVLTNHQQIKANAIVSWQELEKEAPPLPSGLSKQDALIRYILTPVKSPQDNKVIGVLVAGEIVNGKQAIVEQTLQVLGGSYSAVYLNKGGGKFSLATSLNQGEASLMEATSVDLPDKSILAKAAASQGETVTARMVVGKQTYTIAAKAVPNQIIAEADRAVPVFRSEPVAILVQGTNETRINNLLTQSFLQQFLFNLLALILITIWVIILRRAIIKPIQQLKQTTQKFAAGDRSSRAKIFATDEVGQLAVTFNHMADRITQHVFSQENETKLAQLVNQISSFIRGSLNTAQILNAAVASTREAIKADRVVIYRFDENWQGKVIAESVNSQFPVAFGAEIADPCFADNYIKKYQKGRVQALENIYEAGLTECYLAQLEEFAVKANLVAPILIKKKLYGLLIAHQCSGPRCWQKSEINLFKQVAIPVGYALEQAYLLEQVEEARSRAELVSTQQREQKEALQQQIQKLLGDIEGASKGNLTVQAQVTSGEMGIVAECFNSIVESLKAIVTKVKVSAISVNTAVGENEGEIRQLAESALKQTTKINHTLDSVEQMKVSILAVAENAQKFALVVDTASRTAQRSGAAMDLTVQNIVNLHSTVDDTAKKVKRLGESSEKISGVVSLINQIAMQTNLLAVNAGLEAAKVGEENRGFAVLATEIGELAVRCSDATQEIEQIVENIQRETNAVVEAMQLGTTQVVESTRIVKDAKKSLSQILNVSGEIDQLMQLIFLATVSQVETSQAVTKLIKEISQVSELTSNSSQKILKSLEQTAEISQELQATVETFTH